ncbi:hypothetical protein SI65_10131 [Aspergillus cristatus]|uniref:Uncharacterized protein n=1 Tax=Aspergillus cristatus TaxID=573508 RepID=A0A1E3B0R8_ASPCR|nr:hypothetical protein SI65_10131 [Aspergillus cristatus]
MAFHKLLCSLLPALYKRDLFLITRPRYAAQALLEYTKQARKIFSEIYQLFASNRYHRKSYVTYPRREFDAPPEEQLILSCFDEAGQFSNGQDPRDTRVRGLQEALREFAVKRWSDSKNKFFGVFVDRNADISGFDPMQQHQRRKLTWTQPKLLHMLHPICEIDTMDNFAPNEEKAWKLIKIAAGAVFSDKEPNNLRYLYRLGRPLWGRLLGWQDPSEVLSLANTKMFGKEREGNSLTTAQALAILSYRVNFSVTSAALADTLMARHMRYAVGMDRDKAFLQTFQPSEPILACVSTQAMSECPQTRLQVINALYDGVTNYTIHLDNLETKVAALLLLFSYDKVHVQQDSSPRPIKLSKLVESVFGSDRDCRSYERLSQSTNPVEK